MNKYKLKVNIAWLKRKRGGLLKKLKDTAPFIDGSIVKVKRRCGNKNCKCNRGEKHESYYLQYKAAGVTKAVYIPVDMEGEVRRWQEEYRKVKEIIKEICRIQKSIIKRYVSEKKLKKGRQ